MGIWIIDEGIDGKIELYAPNGEFLFAVSKETAAMVGQMLLDAAEEEDEEEPTIDPAADEAFDNWAVMESESERLEEQAEATMDQEFADMMALALSEDLPPDLQEVCEFFI